MSEGGRPALVVLKDGAPLPDDEARALWTEFSAHMEANRGDTAGFAKQKGWHAVAPEFRMGRAVLVVSTTPEAAAKAKAAAPPQGKGGSSGPKPAGKGSPPHKGGSGAKPAAKGPSPKGSSGPKPAGKGGPSKGPKPAAPAKKPPR
ncbi:Hypothetical protein A7982_11451 [Minicystis rosea]|nr:Hypothetical protein A7982_11451 [Minicystis rosea]